MDVSVKLKSTQLRIFSHTEEQLLFQYLTSDMDYTGFGILICMFTGIRIGELCALTWEDISLEANTIRIHRTMQRIQTPEEPTKTKSLIAESKSQCSIREIPIAKTLRSFLELYQDENGYVLTGKVDRFIEPRILLNRYKVILEACGISNANFHTLRHPYVKLTTKFFTYSMSIRLWPYFISIHLFLTPNDLSQEICSFVLYHKLTIHKAILFYYHVVW